MWLAPRSPSPSSLPFSLPQPTVPPPSPPLPCSLLFSSRSFPSLSLRASLPHFLDYKLAPSPPTSLPPPSLQFPFSFSFLFLRAYDEESEETLLMKSQLKAASLCPFPSLPPLFLPLSPPSPSPPLPYGLPPSLLLSSLLPSLPRSFSRSLASLLHCSHVPTSLPPARWRNPHFLPSPLTYKLQHLQLIQQQLQLMLQHLPVQLMLQKLHLMLQQRFSLSRSLSLPSSLPLSLSLSSSRSLTHSFYPSILSRSLPPSSPPVPHPLIFLYLFSSSGSDMMKSRHRVTSLSPIHSCPLSLSPSVSPSLLFPPSPASSFSSSESFPHNLFPSLPRLLRRLLVP